MADLSKFRLAADSDAFDPETYEPPSAYTPPIKAGSYVLLFIDGEYDGEPIRWGETDKGYLKATCSFKVMGGPHDGHLINFQTLTSTPFGENARNKARVRASMVSDFLWAMRYGGRLSSAQDFANALEQQLGKQVKGAVDWAAYCNPKSQDYAGCGNRIKKMTDFPPDNTNPGEYRTMLYCPGSHPEASCVGNHGVREECPNEFAADQHAPILYANNVVKRFSPLE